MFSYLSDIFTSPYSIPIVAIVAGIAVPIITSAWTQLEKHKQECELKRCMIERGFSVDDIERVLSASMQAGSETTREAVRVEPTNANRTFTYS